MTLIMGLYLPLSRYIEAGWPKPREANPMTLQGFFCKQLVQTPFDLPSALEEIITTISLAA